MIDGRNFYGQSVKNDMRTFDNIRKNATGQGLSTGCLFDYPYFKSSLKSVAIHLSKKQALNADSKMIQKYLQEVYKILKIQQVYKILKIQQCLHY